MTKRMPLPFNPESLQRGKHTSPRSGKDFAYDDWFVVRKLQTRDMPSIPDIYGHPSTKQYPDTTHGMNVRIATKTLLQEMLWETQLRGHDVVDRMTVLKSRLPVHQLKAYVGQVSLTPIKNPKPHTPNFRIDATIADVRTENNKPYEISTELRIIGNALELEPETVARFAAHPVEFRLGAVATDDHVQSAYELQDTLGDTMFVLDRPRLKHRRHG